MDRRLKKLREMFPDLAFLNVNVASKFLETESEMCEDEKLKVFLKKASKDKALCKEFCK